jgi:tetratricopeptide (TPR) repeat protein
LIEPTTVQIKLALSQILSSRFFAKAQRPAAFLRFVVEMSLAGQPERIKAYTIGVEVYDRDNDFDPQSDNIVRVNAGRVRQKLNEYYDSPQGSEQPIRIILPERSYIPEFILNSVNPLQAVVTPEANPTNSSSTTLTSKTGKQHLEAGVKVVLFGAVLLVGFATAQWFQGGDAIAETEVEAEPRLPAVIENTPGFKQKLLGDSYFAGEAWPEALVHYHQAVKLAPDNSAYWRQLGRTYSRLDQLEQAQKALEKALAIDTSVAQQSVDIAQGWYYLGANFVRLSQFDQAHHYFIEALVMAQTMAPDAPLLWKYHSRLAHSYSSQDNFTEAQIQLDLAFALVNRQSGTNEDTQRTLHTTRGWMKKRQGRYLEAVVDWKIALQLSIAKYGEQHIKVARQYINLGIAYRKTGRLGEALRHYQKALAKYRAVYGDTHSSIANTHSNIAVILMDQKKYTEAEQQLQQAIKIYQSIYSSKNIRMAVTIQRV